MLLLLEAGAVVEQYPMYCSVQGEKKSLNGFYNYRYSFSDKIRHSTKRQEF